MGIAAIWVSMLVFATIYVAISQPWLGVRLERDPTANAIRIAHVEKTGPAPQLSPGQLLATVGGMTLESEDLVDEPDRLGTYALYARMLARQGELRARTLAPQIALGLGPGGAAVEIVNPAGARPLWALPFTFWLQVLAGASGFLIGVWVWSLRPRELTGVLMAIGGACLLVMIFPAAIYSTRELALDPVLFRWLAAIDHFGALGFGTATVALFYVYPRRLVPLKALLVLPAMVGAWWVADTGWFLFEGPPFGFHLAALILMLSFFPAVALQYLGTRNDPAQRAALRWFALAVLLGTGTFITLIVLPNVVGHRQVINQGDAFLLFIIVYGGVALGVARYRLFELERWAFGVLFYVAGALLMVFLDTFLIFALSLDRVPALGVSLMAVALFYLPLRDTLQRHIVGRAVDYAPLFQQTVDVALAPPGTDQNARWIALLKHAFNPLRIEAWAGKGDSVSRPTIRDEGLILLLPAVGEIRPVTLGYAYAGRKLFSRADEKQALELCAMLDHAIRSRRAREEGVMEERARISRDMHDNIGAKLLSALHSTGDARKNMLIREALSDFRVIINNAFGAPRPLDQTLAELRIETSERLEAAGIDLAWETIDESDTAIPTMIAQTLCSIIREAVSNVIRHAHAKTVSVAIDYRCGRVSVAIADDGRGIGDGDEGRGNGLANMRTRVDALAGTFAIGNADPGTRLSIALSC